MAREIADLIAEVRTGTGKGAARQARREGYVPGIVYGDGIAPQPINIKYYALLKRLKAGRFLSTLFNLKVEGMADVHVVCRGVQRDVVRDRCHRHRGACAQSHQLSEQLAGECSKHGHLDQQPEGPDFARHRGL